MRILLTTLLLPFCCFSAEVPISQAPASKANYPANFQVEQGVNLFVYGDYLYWNVQEEGLYYAQKTNATSTSALPPDATSYLKGSLKQLDPGFVNGLRVGIGYAFPHSGYDLSVGWTWLQTTSCKKSTGSLMPLWAGPDFSPPALATQASAKWHLNYNVLELTWSRPSWFGGHFSLAPLFGVRAAAVQQQLTSSFLYDTSPVVSNTTKTHSTFRGIGLRAGGEGRFTFDSGFAFYALTSGSILYGKFDAYAKTQEDATPIATTFDPFYQAPAALQMALGIAWDTHFANNKYHFEFHAGWEQNLWFGINQMNHYLASFQQGKLLQEHTSLNFQGATIGGQLHF